MRVCKNVIARSEATLCEAVRLEGAPQSHENAVNKGIATLPEPALNGKKRLLRLRLAMTGSEGVAHNDKRDFCTASSRGGGIVPLLASQETHSYPWAYSLRWGMNPHPTTFETLKGEFQGMRAGKFQKIF